MNSLIYRTLFCVYGSYKLSKTVRFFGPPCIYVFIKILSSSLNIMLIVDKQCSDVCCDELPVPQLIAKVNK